ncbi:MAG: trypsin-like peptidase domain-containing protein [Bacteriovoracaceae bacterium]
MKKNTLIITLSLLLSTQAFGEPKSIYGEQGLKKVESTQDQQVNELSNGVCQVLDSDGKGCCTGFFIAEDLVMTNYHCLSCAHENADDQPSMANLLFPPLIPGNDLSGLAQDPAQDAPPRKTNDLREINRTPELFSELKLHIKTNNKSQTFARQKIKIKKLLAGNRGLDFLVMKVEKVKSASVRVNVLSDMQLSIRQELLTIGYPGWSPHPGQKVYDNTDECRVSQSYILRVGSRYDNFGHQCDTNPGSSGSPIFDRLTGKVVGLHWGGGAKRKIDPASRISPLRLDPIKLDPITLADPKLDPIKLAPIKYQAKERAQNELKVNEDESYKNTQNKAVLMSAIVSYLKENHSDIYEALNIQ